MFCNSRWRLTPLWLLLLTALVLAGCRKHTPSKPSKPAATNPAELQLGAARARQALEGLKPQLSTLNTTLKELHQLYDPLPPGLPGFGETRGKFYATAEGVGMMNASVPWLASRIDAAVASGNGAELAAITNDISQKVAEIHEVDRITLELRHEVLPFKNKVEDFLVGKSSCE